MTRTEALAKIRKCLKLAQSPVAAEAAAAMRQAQKLADMHEVDLSAADAPAIEQAKVPYKGGKGWNGRLASVVAKSLGLHVHCTRDHALVFIGPEGTVHLAEYAMACLRRGLLKAKREAMAARKEELRVWAVAVLARFIAESDPDDFARNNFASNLERQAASALRRFGNAFSLGYAASVGDAVQALVNRIRQAGGQP